MHICTNCYHVNMCKYVNRLPSWTCSPPIPFMLYGHLSESFAFVSVFTVLWYRTGADVKQ